MIESTRTAIIGTFDYSGVRYIVYIAPSPEFLFPHFHVGDEQTFPKCRNFHLIANIESPTCAFSPDICLPRFLCSLTSFLDSTDEDGDAVWRYLLKTWNKNSDSIKIPINTPLPRYRHNPIDRKA